MAVRVLIIDDHESVCESLKKALEESGRYTVAGSSPSAKLAELLCASLSPELVFMDVCTDGGASGLTAAERIIKAFPKVKVIMMSGFDEVTYAPRAKEIGASAFVYKTRPLSCFVETADAVMAGETRFNESREIPVLQGETPLTERELEILRMRCRPMSNQEIAQELGISQRTVKFHLDNIKDKTGFSDIMELLLWVSGNGWINPKF